MGMNYTELDTAFMVEKYSAEPSMETVQYLAEKLGKTTKSIIGKLSREGVYKRAVYTSKSGEAPVTKVELVNNIALSTSSSSLIVFLFFFCKQRHHCTNSSHSKPPTETKLCICQSPNNY